jgi:hypothetical protein
MILLELLWVLPLALLAWRAAVSTDPYWMRVTALAVIGVALIGAALVASTPEQLDYSSAFGRFIQRVSTVLALIGSLYLLYWGTVTRDPHPHRLVSIAGGIAGLVPGLLAIHSALTHSPAEPTP